MSSFLDNENQMVVDAILSDIADQLLQDWIDSNLDEGQYYADMQIAVRSGDEFIRDKFNKFYGLKEGDEDYFRI